MRNNKLKTETVIRHWPWILLLLALFIVFLVSSAIVAADPGGGRLPLVEQMESSYSQVKDYRAIFHKQERVDGKLLPEETILLKFQEPLKIYMKWISEPLNGTEALYVKGKYENKLIAHSGGILGMITVSLDPRSPTAMKGRHPITESGFGFIIEQIRRNLDRALQYSEFQIIRMGEEYFNGRPTTVVESRFTPREGRKYYAFRAVIHVDKELMLPVSSAFYDEKDRLFEEYSYINVKLNIGLTDIDFSPQNEKYRF